MAFLSTGRWLAAQIWTLAYGIWRVLFWGPLSAALAGRFAGRALLGSFLTLVFGSMWVLLGVGFLPDFLRLAPLATLAWLGWVCAWGVCACGLAAWIFCWHTRRYLWALGAFLAVVAAATSVSPLALEQLEALGGPRDVGFWLGEISAFVFVGGMLLAFAFSGWVFGRRSGRLGYWELYVLGLLAAALLAWAFADGLRPLLGIESWESAELLGGLDRTAPGALILGDMWERLLGLTLLAGFAVSLVGSSMAVLFAPTKNQSEASHTALRLGSGFGHRFEPGFETEVVRRLMGGLEGGLSVTAWVALLGIALGVAALIAVTSVMSGYQQDIEEKILATNAHLVVQKYGIDFVEYPEAIAKVGSVRGVVAAAPFVFNEATIAVADASVPVLLKGISPKLAGGVTDLAKQLCGEISADGEACAAPRVPIAVADILPKSKTAEVWVGLGLLRRLDASVGSVVNLTAPVAVAGGSGRAPVRLRARIAGAFRSGMHEFDNRLIYIRLPVAQHLLGMGAAVNGIELRIVDPSRAQDVADRMMRRLGHYPYRALDWRVLNASIFTALKLQKVAMFLLLVGIVIVASFNIASTLFMTVIERAEQIAVLKSMGAQDQSIMKIFVFQGWLAGGAGALLGTLLGVGLAYLLGSLQISIASDVYWVATLKVQVVFWEVVGVVLTALGIAHLATLYPALKAAQQRPVDTMRYG